MVQLYTASVHQKLVGIVRHDLPKVVHDRRNSVLSNNSASSVMKKPVKRFSLDQAQLCVSQLPAGTYGEYRSGDEIHINEVIVSQHANIINTWLNASAMRLGRESQWLALVRKAT